ncbi:MAG TPA: multicopper oxidase domain-containing protein [Longimicrobium sp.]|nr:multicopper oxidase domain-containing protein [Longimicrobium sp.]
MRIPVALALVVPLFLVGGGIAVYSYARPAETQLRTFYIAADEVGYPEGAPAPAAGQPAASPGQYRSAVYQEYTDSTFTRVKPRPADWEHLSFLGPLIRADVGDTIRVVFRNRVRFPANVHPDAVLHHPEVQASLSASTPSAAGGLGSDGDDSAVAPGATRVYTWAIPSSAGPGPDDHGSVLWLYHSRTGTANGVDAGLIGPMIIYKRGALRDEAQTR